MVRSLPPGRFPPFPLVALSHSLVFPLLQADSSGSFFWFLNDFLFVSVLCCVLPNDGLPSLGVNEVLPPFAHRPSSPIFKYNSCSFIFKLYPQGTHAALFWLFRMSFPLKFQFILLIQRETVPISPPFLRPLLPFYTSSFPFPPFSYIVLTQGSHLCSRYPRHKLRPSDLVLVVVDFSLRFDPAPLVWFFFVFRFFKVWSVLACFPLFFSLAAV